MTATEMEDVLKNLDRRLTNVEQILPTLATKDDLTKGLQEVRKEMQELSTEDKRHAVMLFEKTQEQLEILASHLVDISQRLPPRA